MSFSDQIIQIRSALEKQSLQLPIDQSQFTLFFSICDTKERANIFHVSGESFTAAWNKGVLKLRRLLDKQKLHEGWLRVDWVTHVEASNWGLLNKRLQDTKRNYFRFGLAFDTSLKHAFLEQELNANAMLYAGGDIENAQLNEKNFLHYATSRFGKKTLFDFSPQTLVYIFSTHGIFCDALNTCHLITTTDLNVGRREVLPFDATKVGEIINNSSLYLASQVKTSGEFFYGWHPCFDRKISTYNTLRHVSSTYAMIEAWELTGDEVLKAAIDRSINYFTQTLIQTYTMPDGQTIAYLVDTGDEIKLGGNAVCLLALVKYCEVTNTTTFIPLLEKLALGIVRMQDPSTGRFNHVLNAKDLSLKEVFRIIYYDGEAAFGLMRLYGLTHDARWLCAVEKAFNYFIINKHWKAHDHWLSYCVNELTRYKPEEKYFRFGIQNISGYLDFVLERITTYPTLLELMMASEQLLLRLNKNPDSTHLMQGLDSKKFYRALEYRAHYLLNGYFWPEMAMYFKNPARIVGSFFIRHHSFRVRIDDVEHYLSGLIAYRKYLLREREKTETKQVEVSKPPVVLLTPSQMARVTGGRWRNLPSDGLNITGVNFYLPFVKSGDLFIQRIREKATAVDYAQELSKAAEKGSIAALVQKNLKPSISLPYLEVESIGKAFQDLAVASSLRFDGKKIVVTGSHGKTGFKTQLHHIINKQIHTHAYLDSANKQDPIWRTLLAIPTTAEIAIIEVAIPAAGIGQDRSFFIRPDICVITGIGLEHLSSHKSISNLIINKAAIVTGLRPGGKCIVNTDDPYFNQICAAIKTYTNCEIVTFGSSSTCSGQLISQQFAGFQWQVSANILGEEINYTLPLIEDYAPLASVGVLLVAKLLGAEVNLCASQYKTYKNYESSGNLYEVQRGEGSFFIYDQSRRGEWKGFESMFELMSRLQPKNKGRKVAVLTEFINLEDNPNAPIDCEKMTDLIGKAGINVLYSVHRFKEHMAMLSPKIDWKRHGETLLDIQDEIMTDILPDDMVFIRGIEDVRLDKLVAKLLTLGTSVKKLF